MRRRKLKALWQRLAEIQPQDLTRDRAGRAVAALVQTDVNAEGKLTFTLDRARLRMVRRREGRYLLRTNLSADNPELLWRCYMQLVFVEEAFRTLKGGSGPAAHLPSQTRTHRSTSVRGVPGLLSVHHAPAAAQGAGRRIDAPRGLREAGYPATAGRARAHHRRTGTSAGAPHRTRSRRGPPAGAAESDVAAATAPTNPSAHRKLNPPDVVATFAPAHVKTPAKSTPQIRR